MEETEKKSNKIIEAYTENHVGHMGDHTPGSLILPRYLIAVETS